MKTEPRFYNDTIDPEDQIAAEEAVASIVFDFDYDEPEARPLEGEAAEIGRRATRAVLRRFRPDLFASELDTP